MTQRTECCVAGIGESAIGKVPDRSALIGQRVAVAFEDLDDEIALPVFRVTDTERGNPSATELILMCF